MELRHLRYFVAVAEEQNVTRAALRLHVSQPPLTRQIQDLEDYLGVNLFARTGKSIRLTEAGGFFLREAREVLARADEAVRRVQSVAGEPGEIHIGYAPSPTARLLPEILKEFRQATPLARVVLCEHSSPEMVRGLQEGKLQAALMVEPVKLAMRGISFERLQTIPIQVALAPDHPLARHRTLTVAQVLAQPLVAYSRRIYPDYHAMLARTLGRSMSRHRFAEECDSGSSLISALQAGRGLAITLANLADVAGSRLRFVPLTPTPLPSGVGVAWRTLDNNPLIQRFVQASRRAAAASNQHQPRQTKS